MSVVIWSLVIIGGLALLLGIGLAAAAKVFAVKKDERVEKIRACLPGANCGGCGFPGCDGFAEAVVKGEATLNGCAVSSADAVAKMGEIMGVSVETGEKKVARVHCGGSCESAKEKAAYRGIADCRAAQSVLHGVKACQYSCIGLGTCVQYCPFDAIHIEDGVAVVEEDKCAGCDACVAVCPAHTIHLEPASQKVFVACSNREMGKAVVNVCTVGCIGCKLCMKNCPEGAIEMVNNVPVIDAEKCTSCGICVEKCKFQRLRMAK